MRTPSLILAGVTATLLTGLASSQEKAHPPGKAEESAKKVKDLQKERIDTLKKVVDVSARLAQSARVEIGELLEARMSLLQAELDVAEKESERIALYKKTLDALKEYEALAKARFEAARGTELGVLKVRARRLEIEILLEQENIKEAKAGK